MLLHQALAPTDDDGAPPVAIVYLPDDAKLPWVVNSVW
jgi:hypothetical protein